MSLALDAVYALVAAATAPWWMRKARGGWSERFGRIEPLPTARAPRLLLHAVSVGEVNLIRALVDRLKDEAEVIVSVTTDTGIERARGLYSGKSGAAGPVRVVRYPLDASWSVRRFLDAVRPDAVGLVELELWPNFLRACRTRQIPVAVINGRLSERSFRGYRLGRPFLRQFFSQLSVAGVQDEAYSARFRHMGVSDERCTIAGSMKWDSAEVADSIPGADELAREMGIDRSRPLIVAGSTAPDEHPLLHESTPPGAQLLCAPRRPEWFDDAARDLPGCVRRSAGQPRAGADRFLLDTIGELRRAYALADVVVIGRSFYSLYGSDPMEPAALGKPLFMGPRSSDFTSAVTALRDAGALKQVLPDELRATLAALMADPAARAEAGRRARACVLEHQGATERYAVLLLGLLSRRAPQSKGGVG